MKMLITKVSQGVVDTERERQRIKKAFRKDPETRQRLTLLMDAIEAGHWKKAYRMLSGKWWSGRDKRCECPRLEFVGMLNVANPKKPGYPASGFDNWSTYGDLVLVCMSRKQEVGGTKVTVTREGNGQE